VTAVGATLATPAVTDPASATTTVNGAQPSGNQGGAAIQQLSPPTTVPVTVPVTVPAPISQPTSPPPVVVSGAS
jgi:hypothetical protein